MKTPGLIEALFQVDAREAALTVCGAMPQDAIYDCMQRHYPYSMTTEGKVLLVFVFACMVAAITVGVFFGLQNAVKEDWRCASKAARVKLYFSECLWEVARSMWHVWCILMVMAFVVIGTQVVLP